MRRIPTTEEKNQVVAAVGCFAVTSCFTMSASGDEPQASSPAAQEQEPQVPVEAKDHVVATVVGAKDAVCSTVAGAKAAVSSAVDVAKGAVQEGMEKTRSAVTSSMDTVMGSSLGQKVVSGLDVVLEKSEQWVDHYLPMTDEELAALATPVEGAEVAPVEKQRQSYYVHLGSLSTSLQQRAYQHSLGKMRHARQSALEALAQLQRAVDLINYAKQTVPAETKDLVATAVEETKDAVCSTVTGAKAAVSSMVDVAKGAPQEGVEMTRSAVSSSMDAVIGSSLGQEVASGLDVVLGKSEHWVDHYLPVADEELAALATSVQGAEVAPLEQQKQQQSYYVRLGSLSTSLQQRAYQHSLGKMRRARQSALEALVQLQQVVDVVRLPSWSTPGFRSPGVLQLQQELASLSMCLDNYASRGWV
ncbi:perilipin-3-like [Alligator mississippiensis]|uniref:Perilipin-3-like n=1 Tax=Alligator mississippiensis TaxID=8496 RepID=A0A151N3L9_ALLMI|nr:perilipin-3-like [Alligator mississippiensis]